MEVRRLHMSVLSLLFCCWVGVAQLEAQAFVPDTLMLTQTDTALNAEKAQMLPGTRRIFSTDTLLEFARGFKGRRYRRGGTGSRGFDCSGFTMVVFARFGYRLPHTSAGQSLFGIEVPRKNARKGDLIFFKGRSRRSKRIGHVGIVVSNKAEPIRFIHSSVEDGVREDRLDSEYYRRRFVKITRVLFN